MSFFVSSTTPSHCSFVGGSDLYNVLFIVFLLAISNVLIRYLSSPCALSCVRFPRCNTGPVLGISFPNIFFHAPIFLPNTRLSFGTLHMWSAPICPHCLQHKLCSSCCVVLYLITFFHPNSLHTLDPVVECCTQHKLYHSSSVSSIPRSFSHFSFMYIVEFLLLFNRA